MLLSELEQLKLLVQIKLQSASKLSGVQNQFKITGTNLNGSLGIGNSDQYAHGESVWRLQ